MTPRFIAVAALTLALAAWPVARGQEEDPFGRFAGVYVADSVEGHAETIHAAIQSGTEEMPGLRRNVARRRLSAVNRAVRTIELRADETSWLSVWDGHAYPAPRNGGWREQTDPEGKDVRVSYAIRGTCLVGRFVGGDGEKRVTFTPSEDGRRLRLTIVLSSDRLPADITYRLAYRRR